MTTPSWDSINAGYEHVTHAGFWLFVLWRGLKRVLARIQRLKIDRSGIEIDLRNEDEEELDLKKLRRKL